MVVNPYINKLITQNLNGEYNDGGSLGYFPAQGGSFKQRCLETATAGCRIRWAVSVAMDKDGMVDYGVVGKMFEGGPWVPHWMENKFSKLKHYTEQMTGKADFIVIETGT